MSGVSEEVLRVTASLVMGLFGSVVGKVDDVRPPPHAVSENARAMAAVARAVLPNNKVRFSWKVRKETWSTALATKKSPWPRTISPNIMIQ
jgi:hypothetical protein